MTNTSLHWRWCWVSICQWCSEACDGSFWGFLMILYVEPRLRTKRKNGFHIGVEYFHHHTEICDFWKPQTIRGLWLSTSQRHLSLVLTHNYYILCLLIASGSDPRLFRFALNAFTFSSTIESLSELKLSRACRVFWLSKTRSSANSRSLSFLSMVKCIDCMLVVFVASLILLLSQISLSRH